MVERDYFQLFGLEQQFLIDAELLRQRYIALQAKCHPDKFVGKTSMEKRLAIQTATQINDGYQILQDPISRAKYLAQKYAINFDKESTYQADSDFLMHQMALREALEELEADSIELQEYQQNLQNKINEYYETLNQIFLAAGKNSAIDSAHLKQAIFELQFYQKIMKDFSVKFSHS